MIFHKIVQNICSHWRLLSRHLHEDSGPELPFWDLINMELNAPPKMLELLLGAILRQFAHRTFLGLSFPFSCPASSGSRPFAGRCDRPVAGRRDRPVAGRRFDKEDV